MWYNYLWLHIPNPIDQTKVNFVEDEELLRHKTHKKRRLQRANGVIAVI